MDGGRKKVNVTLSIDRDIKNEFKLENVRNSTDMSVTVENFMVHYIATSKKLHEERMAKKMSNEQG